MLINWQSKELDIELFKKYISKIDWIKKEEIIKDLKQITYRGDFEDENKKIKVIIRPTKWMQIHEIFKNRLQNGVPPEKDFKPSRTNPLVDFGCSCQVFVDDSFVEKIDTLAKEFKRNPVQKVSWS